MTPALLAGLLALPGADLLFPSADGPARLRVVAAVAGRSPEEGWGRFLDRLFDHFDRDGNGTLDSDEAKRVFPLPLPGGRSVAPDTLGRVTRAEFRAHYRRAGFTPVVVAHCPPSADDRRLAAALFCHLDRDGNGRLSAAELADAPWLLRRFDEDEDEALTPAEILAGTATVPPAAPPAWPETPGADRSTPDALLRINLAGGERPELTGTRFRVLAADPLRFAVPGGECRVVIRSDDPAAGVREAREFLLAQFRTAAGDRPALTRAEVEQEPSLRGLLGVFDPADRNGDGKLTETELTGLLDLIAQGVGCQVVVTAEDRDRSLFDRLDANGDRRLDLWELRRAADLKEGVSADDLPRVLRLTVSRGPVGAAFGPVPVAVPAAKAGPRPAPRRAGPDWFRAMDRNGDGFVSPAEFIGPPELFRKLDRDRDGRISPAEAEGK